MLFKKLVKVALGISLILPLGWIALKFFSDGPNADPAKQLSHLFGSVGFYALGANLTIGSALATLRIFGRSLPQWLVPIVPYRRHLGVAGALYLVCHVSLHFIMEAGIAEGFAAIGEAQYLWYGSAAYLGILALAITSNNWSMRKLRAKWKPIHRSVYVIFLLAAAHTLSIEKADLLQFGAITIAVLLPLLMRFLRRFLTGQRKASAA